MITSAALKAQALGAGFDLCGIAPAAAHPELAFLDRWLARGYAGQMEYMARTAAARADARRVLPSARSVIVLGTVYNSPAAERQPSSDRALARLSRYAWGEDYHHVIRQRLDALLAWMRTTCAEPFEARPYVDTGPVQERVYAQHAGLGWIGKNTCVISPELGSWFFLSVILCSLELEPDEPEIDRCANCTLCLSACPTGALVEPRVLDATRCISYLTIELREGIPVGLRGTMANHAYGCDVCQEVCPWNQRPAISDDGAWAPRSGLDRPQLLELWRRSDAELIALVRGGPMTRPRLAGLRRNLAVAIGNAAGAIPPDALDDAADPERPSLADPMVREHIAWARARLASAPAAGG